VLGIDQRNDWEIFEEGLKLRMRAVEYGGDPARLNKQATLLQQAVRSFRTRRRLGRFDSQVPICILLRTRLVIGFCFWFSAVQIRPGVHLPR